MTLKSITFYFENFDEITIDGKDVGYFLVDDIQKGFRGSRDALGLQICETETPHCFAIEIYKSADVERYQHGNTSREDMKQMTFERFCCRDIVHIHFELADNESGEEKSYTYYLHWSGEFRNKYQKNAVSKYGDLYIVVDEHKDITDYFEIFE